MERRRVILIASVAITVVVALLLWWFLIRPGEGPAQPGGTTPTTTTPGGELPQLTPIAPSTPQPAQTGAMVAARVWAERFASWSNEDGFTNFDPLADLSTLPVQTFLVSYRADLARRYPLAGGYHGQTARALGPKLVDFSEAAGTAHVQVAMQLAESTSSAPMISNRTIDLKLTQSAGAWLVDFVKWL
jgi:hypothetical protein